MSPFYCYNKSNLSSKKCCLSSEFFKYWNHNCLKIHFYQTTHLPLSLYIKYQLCKKNIIMALLSMYIFICVTYCINIDQTLHFIYFVKINTVVELNVATTSIKYKRCNLNCKNSFIIQKKRIDVNLYLLSNHKNQL